MNILICHARGTFAAAFNQVNRWKAILLVLSVGLGLFCFSLSVSALVDAPLSSFDRVPVVPVLIMGLTLGGVPLWRGLLWTTSGPTALPIRPRTAAAVEGLVFTAVSNVPHLCMWFAFGWALSDGAGVELSQTDIMTTMLQVGATVVCFGLVAPIVAQLSGHKIPTALWTLLALPATTGILLTLTLAADGPSVLLEIAAVIMCTFLGGLGLFCAIWMTGRTTGENTSEAVLVREGRLDRFAMDTRQHLIRRVVTAGLLTLAGWTVLDVFLNDIVGDAQFRLLLEPWAGLLVLIPLLPRLVLLDAPMGFRISEVPQPSAWSLLPVDPTALRRRMLVLSLAPLATAAVVDFAVILFRRDSVEWLTSVATVNMATSLVMSVALGTLILLRMPKTPHQQTA